MIFIVFLQLVNVNVEYETQMDSCKVPPKERPGMKHQLALVDGRQLATDLLVKLIL